MVGAVGATVIMTLGETITFSTFVVATYSLDFDGLREIPDADRGERHKFDSYRSSCKKPNILITHNRQQWPRKRKCPTDSFMKADVSRKQIDASTYSLRY